MLLNPWLGFWYNKLEMIKMLVDDDNEIYMVIIKGRARNVQRFSNNAFWNNIGSLI